MRTKIDIEDAGQLGQLLKIPPTTHYYTKGYIQHVAAEQKEQGYPLRERYFVQHVFIFLYEIAE